MLKKREQWLPHIMNLRHSKKILEESLQNVINENIAKCQKYFPHNLQNEIGELLVYAGKNLQKSESSNDFFKQNSQVFDFVAKRQYAHRFWSGKMDRGACRFSGASQKSGKNETRFAQL